MGRTETTYNKFLKSVFYMANPIKKSIMKTSCIMHIQINIYALEILKNDEFQEQYDFFHRYISEINEGAVWADQDFKSSHHFYSPNKDKGLYGRDSAMDLGVDYYNNAVTLWKEGNYYKSMFNLGAALHIIQDMTVPQHANIRLLDEHRKYETFVKKNFNFLGDIAITDGPYFLNSVEDYIRFNARVALRIYKRYSTIDNADQRFYNVGRCSLPVALRTTAGAMIMFYDHINLVS